MTNRIQQTWIVLFLSLATALSFWVYPGTTFCEEDTQIYLPIIQQKLDPGLFQQELITQHPHTAFSLYDEMVEEVTRTLHLELEVSLRGLQFVFRFLMALGFFLMGRGLKIADETSACIAGFLLLGASVPGPSIYTVELEPVPRAMALSLVILAVGLICLRHLYLGTLLACVGHWLHPTTTLPFWAGWLLLLLTGHLRMGNKQRLLLASMPAGATSVLIFAASLSPSEQSRYFFSFLDPSWETLLWLRTPYDFVSSWSNLQYCLLAGTAFVLVLAWIRNRDLLGRILKKYIQPTTVWAYFMLLFSWLLLDLAKLAVLAQAQPARALVFPVIWMLFLSWCAGLVGLKTRGITSESLLWLISSLAFAVDQLLLLLLWPVLSLEVAKNNLILKAGFFKHKRAVSLGFTAIQGVVLCVVLWLKPFKFDGTSAHTLRELIILAGIALVVSWVLQVCHRPVAWRWVPMLVLLVGVFWIVPTCLRKPSRPATPFQIYELANWARDNTPLDSVFLFPDSHRDKLPGYFRFRAERAVYVDWKGGGQINFSRLFAEEWWRRWQAAMERPLDGRYLRGFRSPPLNYLVTNPERAISGLELIHKTSAFNIYRISE